jgi:glycosyltransferase involved in cell wall biosynthesis
MRVLLVANGFPPSGQWGTEFYTHQLAVGLLRGGHRVSVISPRRDGTRPRYTVDRNERYGVDVIEIHNAGDPAKHFADSYHNESIERVFDDLLGEIVPDVVHFTHLLWGLSIRLPEIARRRGITTVATITDLGLLCHRGQMLDSDLQPCEEARDAARCARCIRRPGPWDLGRFARIPRKMAVAVMAAVGGMGRVVVEEDLRLRRAEVRRALAHIDHAIAPTRALRRRFLEAGLPVEHMTVLPYGIDESAYGMTRTRSWEGTHFGFLGQFMPHKGLDVLFAAVDLMRRRLPESVEPWEVILYGNPMRGRHHRYLGSHYHTGLAGRLRFRGPFEPLDAPRILAGLDVVVLSSRWMENAPLTVLQARAAGVPVIASDVPGVREVLEPGVHGTLVPPGDARALAAAMRAMIIGCPEWHPAPPVPDPVLPWAEHLETVVALYGDVRATAASSTDTASAAPLPSETATARTAVAEAEVEH